MIPNYLEDVKAAAVKYADAFKHCHVEGDPRRHEFIKLLAKDLNAKDAQIGLNGKRGNPNDLSMDALNYIGEGAGSTPNGVACSVIDCVSGAGGANPQPVWNVFTTPVEASGAWVDPDGVSVAPPAPVPVMPSYEELGGDEGAKKITRMIEADYKRAGRPGLDGDCGGWLRRTDYDVLSGKVKTVEESIAKHRPEWCAALGIPVA